MKYIIGRKVEMSQRYRPTGEVVPVTIVRAEPCTVTQVRTADKDGYVAVQVGCGETRHTNKPMAGHLGTNGNLATLREFRLEIMDAATVGSKITVEAFKAGDAIEVMGVSKGKGFQGVVKRHHFAGGPASHGHKDNLRMPGSIGSGGNQRVFKGMKMGGRMGGEQVTVKNLEVVEIMPEQNLIAIKGAVPGARGALLMISGPGEMTYQAPTAPAAEVKAEAAN